MEYKEIEGNLLNMALNRDFDLIAQGCNCMCKMEAGLAPQMKKLFGCDDYLLEDKSFRGNINKLGQIDVGHSYIAEDKSIVAYSSPIIKERFKDSHHLLRVVNCYTQYNYGKNYTDGDQIPFDYEAFTICMRKINKTFKGLRIGLPQIGCGLAGGKWARVKIIILKELTDCDVTVVIY